MQIVCPTCSAAYEVSPTLIKPGLAVRCVRCANEWVPEAEPVAPPPAPPSAAPPVVAPAVAARPMVPPQVRPIAAPLEPMPVAPPLPQRSIFRPLPPPPPPPPSVAPRLAWVASILLLLLLGAATYTLRADVMRLWPPSIRLYSALGLTAD